MRPKNAWIFLIARRSSVEPVLRDVGAISRTPPDVIESPRAESPSAFKSRIPGLGAHLHDWLTPIAEQMRQVFPDLLVDERQRFYIEWSRHRLPRFRLNFSMYCSGISRIR
jgi:hypothetical protein